MDSKNEIKGLLREMMNEDALKKNQADQDEKYAALLEENVAFKAAEEKRLASPGTKVSLEVPGETKTVDFIYKGYDLRRQCQDLSIADDDRKDRHAKFLIDMIQKADMTESTHAEFVPDEYELDLMALARLESVALRECRIFNVSRDVLVIPIETAGQTVDVQAYGTANTQSEPTIDQIKLDMKRIGNFSICYNDLLEDSWFDISSWLTGLNAEAIGQAIDEYVFTGSSFTGDLFDLTTNIVTISGTIADISYEHFSESISKLTDNKLNGMKFYMNKAATHYIRTETDDDGRLIWTAPTAGNPATIYGFPYVQVEKLPSAPSAGDAFGVFGNLKYYYLGVRKGIEMQVNPYKYMAEGKTQFICHTRLDGDVGLEAAMGLFKLQA